jgi:hypothetical protein
VLRFGFGIDPNGDTCGHQGHVGIRPQGSYSRTTARTDSNGNADTVYTAPAFGGSTQPHAAINGGKATFSGGRCSISESPIL